MRAHSFFVVSALAAACAVGASGAPAKPEPSESQMKLSFRRYFSQLEPGAVSGFQFSFFKKHACKPSATEPGHYYCSFTYSTDVPADRTSILPPRATISGIFAADDDGQLRFEMAIG